MPDQLGLANSQQITPEDAANTALVGLLASKAAAKKFAKAKGVQQLRQANATLSTHGGVDALENAQRKTLAVFERTCLCYLIWHRHPARSPAVQCRTLGLTPSRRSCAGHVDHPAHEHS